MTIIQLLTTIESSWPLLIFVFALGGIWWQGKTWYSRVNILLERANAHHREQGQTLEIIKVRSENLAYRVDKIDALVVQIHNDLHGQEVKLAVLETAQRSQQNRGV